MQTDTRQRDRFVLGLQMAAALLMAHQVAGKAVRDGLFLSHYGPRPLTLMIAGAAAVSVALSLLSGRLLARIPPRRIVPAALFVSGLLQVGQWALLGPAPGFAAVLFYLHVSAFGAVLLSSFWSMMGDEFDPREAKRRFGQIAAGGTLGGLAGGLAAERSVTWLGPAAVLLLVALLHMGAAILLGWLGRRQAPSPVSPPGPDAKPAAFHRSDLLNLLTGMVLLAAVGAALLDYALKVYATQETGSGQALTRFFALFYTATSVLNFIMQSALSKLFLERFGLGASAIALPSTLLGGSLISLFLPGVGPVAFARAFEGAVRGSIFRACYETSFTAVPTTERRLAKTFIDVGADRGGEALAMGLVALCIWFGQDHSLVWILGATCLIGLASIAVSSSLDTVYLKALASNLVSRTVDLNPDSDLDLTTKSLILKSGMFPTPGAHPAPLGEPAPLDPVTRALCELRSSDPATVQSAIQRCDANQPLIAAQLVQLLANDRLSLLAHTKLHASAERVVGLLADLMLSPEEDLAARRRIPRILGSVWTQRSIDALLAGLDDPRFEVRLQSARYLLRTAPHVPNAVLPAARILVAVDRELSKGRLLWESHRAQHEETECLDELLETKAHASLEYVFTLLSLLFDRKPLMAAFRALHTEDRHLLGTALEYLEGILPPRTRELLWEIVGDRPSSAAPRSGAEVLSELMQSSETVVIHLKRDKPPARPIEGA